MYDNRQLVALIKRYYPKADRWPEGLKDQRWMYWVSGWGYCAAVMAFMIYAAYSATPQEYDFHLFANSLGFIMLSVIGGVPLNYSSDPEKGTPYWYMGPFFVWLQFRRWQWLRRALRNPYSSELILGTVKALEVELAGKKASAKKLLDQRRSTLRQHQMELLDVLEAMNGRNPSDPLGEEAVQLARRKLEAESALDQIERDRVELNNQQEAVEEALLPARLLADSLRLLYRDAHEAQVIARAKMALARSEDRATVRKQLTTFHQEVLKATTNLETISDYVGAKLKAEREIETIIGIIETPELSVRA